MWAFDPLKLAAAQLSVTIQTLAGYARATCGRAVAPRISFPVWAAPGRATLARMKGSLKTRVATAGKSRATMARAFALLGYVIIGGTTALAGKGRATQDRAKGALITYAPARLASISRATQGRARSLSIRINFRAAPARPTQARTKSLLTVPVTNVGLVGKARATQARARAPTIANNIVWLAKARATQGRARASLSFTGGTTASVAGKARATQARAWSPRLSYTVHAAPARATQAVAHAVIGSFTAPGVDLYRARATQARVVSDIDLIVYISDTPHSQARARGVLSVGTGGPIAALSGKARATQARIRSDIDIKIYAVAEARATQARARGLASGVTVNPQSLVGKARATQARARATSITVTQYAAEARATQGRGKSNFIINRTPLVAKSRATQARTLVDHIYMVYYAAESRSTQARATGNSTLVVIVQPSPATQARARASARFANIVIRNLSGKARATQARGRGAATIHVNFQLRTGTARATQGRTRSEITLNYWEAPSRATQARVIQSGSLTARHLAGVSRATQARTLSETIIGYYAAAAKATQARTLVDSSVRIPQGPSRASGARVFGRGVNFPPSGPCFPAVYECTVVLVGTVTVVGPPPTPVIIDITSGNQIVPGLGCITTADVVVPLPPPEPLPEPTDVALAGTAVATQASTMGTLTMAVPPEVVIVAYTTFQMPLNDGASLISTPFTVSPYSTTWQLSTVSGNTDGFVRADGALTSGVSTSRRLLYTDTDWPNENFEVYADWVRPSSSELVEDCYLFACASADYAHFYQIAWRPVWLADTASIWFIADQGLQSDVTGFSVPTGTNYPRLGFTVGPGATNYISLWTEPSGGGTRTVHLTLTPEVDYRGSIYKHAGFGATTLTPLGVKCILWGWKSPGG